jgi:hypothetical protein
MAFFLPDPVALKGKGNVNPTTDHDGRGEGRGGEGVSLYSCFNFGARWDRVVNATPRPLYSRETDPVPSGWAPGSVRTGVENFGPTGIQPRTVHPVASRYTPLY